MVTRGLKSIASVKSEGIPTAFCELNGTQSEFAQLVIENILGDLKLSVDAIFLYYAKIENSQIPAFFENELNFAFVNSVDNLLNVINSNSFKITTRTTKFVLSLNESDFNHLIVSINKNNKYEIISSFYHRALLNKYQSIENYKQNFEALKLLVKSNFNNNQTIINYGESSENPQEQE
jgi:hypothetical protein